MAGSAARSVDIPEGVPAGPVRDWLEWLRELRRCAGLPSLSRVAQKAAERGSTISVPTISRVLRGETVTEQAGLAVAYTLAEMDVRPTRRTAAEQWEQFDAVLEKLLGDALRLTAAHEDAESTPASSDRSGDLIAVTLRTAQSPLPFDSPELGALHRFIAEARQISHLPYEAEDGEDLIPARALGGAGTTPSRYVVVSDGPRIPFERLPTFEHGLFFVNNGQYLPGELRTLLSFGRAFRQVVVVGLKRDTEGALAEILGRCQEPLPEGRSPLDQVAYIANRLCRELPDLFSWSQNDSRR